MNKKSSFIKGTFILVLAGIAARIIGFFFRIFLSRTLGADGIGIYQLIFPIQGLCYAFCAAGIQTVISQQVAASVVSNETSPRTILKCGMILSFILSVLTAVTLYKNAGFISSVLLSEKRCTVPLQYLSYSIPFSSIHSCICGYYYGLNKAGIPAFSQFLEQIARVLATYCVWIILCRNGEVFSPESAVIGAVAGELVSSAYCMYTLNVTGIHKPDISIIKNIARGSIPLTSNRLLLSVFQSAEAILLPFFLRKSGMSSSDALSIYGILTGMALPFIMFPATITNAMSTLLLPAIAKADARNNTEKIKFSSEKTIMISLILGIFCTGIFYNYGNDIGLIIFNNKTSGYYLIILAWLCPFLYLNTTLSSILNGLGHTTTTFLFNILSIAIRIIFTIFAVPPLGISAYLCGILVSQFILCLTQYKNLLYYVHPDLHMADAIILPVLLIFISEFLSDALCTLLRFNGLYMLMFCCVITSVLFFSGTYFFILKKDIDI